MDIVFFPTKTKRGKKSLKVRYEGKKQARANCGADLFMAEVLSRVCSTVNCTGELFLAGSMGIVPIWVTQLLFANVLSVA